MLFAPIRPVFLGYTRRQRWYTSVSVVKPAQGCWNMYWNVKTAVILFSRRLLTASITQDETIEPRSISKLLTVAKITMQTLSLTKVSFCCKICLLIPWVHFRFTVCFLFAIESWFRSVSRSRMPQARNQLPAVVLCNGSTSRRSSILTFKSHVGWEKYAQIYTI